jgi:hypothetical protein
VEVIDKVMRLRPVACCLFVGFIWFYFLLNVTITIANGNASIPNVGGSLLREFRVYQPLGLPTVVWKLEKSEPFQKKYFTYSLTQPRFSSC